MQDIEAETRIAFRLRLDSLGLDVETLRVASPEGSLRPTLAPSPSESPQLPPLRSFAGADETARAELELGDVIGEGGMGVVRLARQVALRRTVAVKALKGRHDGERTSELLREARVTGALEHPNIVPVYTLGLADDGGPLLVLKRVEGRSWRHEMASLPFDVVGRVAALDRHLELFSHVCNAVHFANSRGVVHRDLKPDNVMIGGFGEVYVLDWGVAVAFREDADPVFPRASEIAGLVGTPCFMAPEMSIADVTQLSPRTDVYLLGAILHELVTGRRRHEGDVMQCLYRAYTSEAPEYGAEVPGELASICRRALARDPMHRFGSAEELRVAVMDFLRHRTSRELVGQAQRRLDEVAGAPPSRVHRLLGEARFGFEQALAAWPESPEARSGLLRASELLCEHELSIGDAAAAARALEDLKDAPPELAGRVAALQQRVESARRHIADLEANARERDLRASHGAAVAIIAGMGATWTGVPFFIAWAQKTQGWVLTNEMYLQGNAMFAVLVVSLVVLGRRVLFRNQASRQLVATLALLVLFSALVRLGGYVGGVPLVRTAPSEMLVYSVFGLLVGLWMDRAIVPAGIAYLAGAVAAMFLPTHTFEILGCTNFVAMTSAAWLIMRRGAPAEA